jgi:NADPH:quinone reductase
MAFAIRVHTPGGPEALVYEKVETPHPGPGEVLVRHTAIGVNYIDVYHRSGIYPLPAPFTPGLEAAGIVEEVGEGVKDFKKGERVAYAMIPVGAYAQFRIMPHYRLIKIPKGVTEEQAAAGLAKGMTVEYLLHRTYKVKPGDTILLHAAAGGVGLIACQWARHLGATVIGTVGSTEKAELAKDNGCNHVILYNEEDFVARVMEITDGQGVPVVYDSVGKDTFEASLACVAPRGTMVSFGNASGMVPPVNLLAAKGSIFITRPALGDYIKDVGEYQHSAKMFFDVLRAGKVDVAINQTYALKDATQAHRDLEDRKTTGSSILIV